MLVKLLTELSGAYYILCNLLNIIYMQYKDKIFSKDLIRPWMKYNEMFIIKELLKSLSPKNCLEWGTGYSTLYFPKFLKRATWLSIEHDADWANKIKVMNQQNNVKIIHIPPNQYPWTDSEGDGCYQDLNDYINFPLNYGSFDFIFIDGRARKDCLIKSYNILKRNGIIALHDANRKYYHEPLGMYKYSVFFRDCNVDGGGLWIGSKDINLPIICKKLMAVWNLYNKLDYCLCAKEYGTSNVNI